MKRKLMKKIPTQFEPLHPIQIIWKFTDCPRKDGQVLCYLLREDYDSGEMIVLWTMTCRDARQLVKWYRRERELDSFLELKDYSLRLEISQQDTPIGKQFDFKIGNWIHRLTLVEMEETIRYIQERLLDK